MKAYFQHFCRCIFIQRTFVYLFIFNAYFSRNLYGEIFGSKDGENFDGFGIRLELVESQPVQTRV